MTAIMAIILLVAGVGGSGDYALIVPGQPPMCAKSSQSCEMARTAISKGWFLKEIPPDTPTSCAPSPGCFSTQSNCIVGYSC